MIIYIFGKKFHTKMSHPDLNPYLAGCDWSFTFIPESKFKKNLIHFSDCIIIAKEDVGGGVYKYWKSDDTHTFMVAAELMK